MNSHSTEIVDIHFFQGARTLITVRREELDFSFQRGDVLEVWIDGQSITSVRVASIVIPSGMDVSHEFFDIVTRDDTMLSKELVTRCNCQIRKGHSK